MQGGNRQIRTVGELRPLLPEEKYLQRQKTITDSKNTEETPQTRRKEEINLLLIIFFRNGCQFIIFSSFLSFSSSRRDPSQTPTKAYGIQVCSRRNYDCKDLCFR